MREALLPVFAALFGAVVGSFLNVVIWRLPRGENLSRPRSRCPRCGALIRWFDNVPILSWLLLRARCRGCKARISARYPVVEALTAGLFLLAYLRWEPDLVTAALVAVALAAFVAITYIDWDHRIIPDRITKPGMVLAVALAPLMATHPRGWVSMLPDGMGPWAHALAGLLLGLGLILLIRLLGRIVFRKEAMGLGDAKLLALIGALTGPMGALYAIIIGSLVGAVVGILLFLVGRKRPRACQGTLEGSIVGEAGAQAFRHPVTSVRFRDDTLLVPAPGGGAPGTPVRLTLTLPASKVLEDADAIVRVKALVGAVERVGTAEVWELSDVEASEEDQDRLAIFSQSHRYVPFGPFLSLGGAAALLYADTVHWVLTVAYPRWVQSIVGAVLAAIS